MIRSALKTDLPVLLKLTKACAIAMIKQGIFQWNEHYPNPEVFINDLNRQELYVYENEGKVIACIVISTFMDEEYKDISWGTTDGDHLYIHRLAVHPSFQGQGIAKQLMDYAENKGRERNKTSVRLDTFSLNKRNQKFYKLRGYVKRGQIFFPKQSEAPFYCYDLKL